MRKEDEHQIWNKWKKSLKQHPYGFINLDNAHRKTNVVFFFNKAYPIEYLKDTKVRGCVILISIYLILYIQFNICNVTFGVYRFHFFIHELPWDLGNDNLVVSRFFLHGLEFKVSLFRGWLSCEARESSLRCYLTKICVGNNGFMPFQGHLSEVNAIYSAGIWSWLVYIILPIRTTPSAHLLNRIIVLRSST